MAAPYFLMAFLYLALAALAVLAASLANWQLLPALPNLRWLTVHLVVLGTLTEFTFGALPLLAAARANRPKPRFRWETWLLLNAGIAVLVPGVTTVNFLLLTTGGTAIFLAVLQLARELFELRPVPAQPGSQSLSDGPAFMARRKFKASGGLKFYLAGLAYLLVGILVGTGLWQGWAGPLQIAIPKEVHVHANLWGFTALVFAGLLIDISHHISERKLSSISNGWIFWLLSLGALGLVLGPWLNVNWLQVVGLGAHTIGSGLLIGQVFWPARQGWRQWRPGVWHILLSYVWFFLPVVVAPLVVFSIGAGSEVAGSGGPLLIYGWILQFGYAVIPALLRMAFRPGEPLRLGGSWLSLAAVGAGSLAYWASLFIPAGQGLLRGIAFSLWLLSLLPVLAEIASIYQVIQAKVRAADSDLSR